MMNRYGPIGNAMMGQAAPAMPVHSTEEVRRRFRGKGMKVPGEIGEMTQMYEGAPPGPIRQQLHSAQHGMLLSNQNALNQAKRMDLANKSRELQQMITSLTRQGRLQEADNLQRQLDVLLKAMGSLPGMGEGGAEPGIP